jgi:DNA-binding transcriptional ArsR family regulator/predicted transcriptional regulator
MGTDFTGVGSLLSNPGRSAIINQLLDGRSMSASDLGRAAHVAPSTASEHLAALRGGGLVRVHVRGRLRLYSIAGPEVGEALESLARICPPTRVASLSQSIARRNLTFARTCYDHLAGKLGVALNDALVEDGWLRIRGDGYELTGKGLRCLRQLGIDVDSARRARRAFARPCLDWTEQRNHLAGALGAAIATSFFERGWIRRRQRSERSVELTRAGQTALTSLHVDVSALSDLAS